MIDIIIIILPFIAIGIGMVLLINSLKNKYKTRNQDEQSTNEDYMSLGMLLGLCFGAAIGSMFTNTFGTNSISYGV
ncbi:hypothetical protein R1Z16_003084, partial [Clostridium perfringens]|nr:hypothetical protein [Clostridium perfringens]